MVVPQEWAADVANALIRRHNAHEEEFDLGHHIALAFDAAKAEGARVALHVAAEAYREDYDAAKAAEPMRDPAEWLHDVLAAAAIPEPPR